MAADGQQPRGDHELPQPAAGQRGPALDGRQRAEAPRRPRWPRTTAWPSTPSSTRKTSRASARRSFSRSVLALVPWQERRPFGVAALFGYWVTGLLGCRVAGLLGYWVTGLLGYWVAWLLGCLVAGLLGCWVAWLLGCLVAGLLGC